MLTILISGCSRAKFYYVDNCSVERNNGGQVLTCGNDSVSIPDQMPITAVIDPCGDGPGIDEVVIVLEKNLYLAWYAGLGLVILNENTSYMTTDAQACKFKIINGVLELL